MAEIIYLKKGERRPAGDKALLIECKRRRRQDELEQSAAGVTIRTSTGALKGHIADFERKGVKKIYVRIKDDAKGS